MRSVAAPTRSGFISPYPLPGYNDRVRRHGRYDPSRAVDEGRRRGSIYSRRRFVPLTTIFDLPAGAARTDQPLAPIEHGRPGAVPSGHLGGVGLDLVTIAAPHDEARAGQPRASMSINKLGI